jgi:hypothetical protein
VRWQLKGDMVLKEFFQSKKEISTFTTITSMWNKDNILVNNWVEMEAVCLDYFDLYNSPPQSPENEVAIAGGQAASISQEYFSSVAFQN